MALEPLGQTTKEGKVREDFLHRLIKYFLFPCFILIHNMKILCVLYQKKHKCLAELASKYLFMGNYTSHDFSGTQSFSLSEAQCIYF